MPRSSAGIACAATARRGTRQARRRRPGGSGADAACRRPRRRRRPPSAGGSSLVAWVIGVQPQQRERRAAGRADRAVQPALAARRPRRPDAGPGPRPSRSAAHRGRRARARSRSIPAGSASPDRARVPRRLGEQVRPRTWDAADDAVSPAAEGDPLAARDLVRQPVQRGDRGALPVDRQLEIRERILVVRVAAALGHQHVRRERADGAGHDCAERAQPTLVVGAGWQRDVDRRALGIAASRVRSAARCRGTACADPDAG